VNALRVTYEHIFTSGGIGPTHDDITADAIADAFGAAIGVREDARALLAAHYARAGLEFNEARMRMARVPENAVRHLPDMENGQLLGMISIGDLVKGIISEQQFIIEQLEHYITGVRAA